MPPLFLRSLGWELRTQLPKITSNGFFNTCSGAEIELDFIEGLTNQFERKFATLPSEMQDSWQRQVGVGFYLHLSLAGGQFGACAKPTASLSGTPGAGT